MTTVIFKSLQASAEVGLLGCNSECHSVEVTKKALLHLPTDLSFLIKDGYCQDPLDYGRWKASYREWGCQMKIGPSQATQHLELNLKFNRAQTSMYTQGLLSACSLCKKSVIQMKRMMSKPCYTCYRFRYPSLPTSLFVVCWLAVVILGQKPCMQGAGRELGEIREQERQYKFHIRITPIGIHGNVDSLYECLFNK